MTIKTELYHKFSWDEKKIPFSYKLLYFSDNFDFHHFLLTLYDFPSYKARISFGKFTYILYI